MGVQGPLTAQALGRSPYDDVVEGEGIEDFREGTQQYDYRGRPINPDTKNINRDIVRSHNEVMQVIGVAEPEYPSSGLEIEAHRRHEDYEETIGINIAAYAGNCVELVGTLGINGLRQRVLVYNRYSNIPFWNLYRQARNHYSLTKDILPGSPAILLITLVENYVWPRWHSWYDRPLARRCVLEIWSYIRCCLELHVVLQRLGLTSDTLLLPHPRFFIPFTKESPVFDVPPLEGSDAKSLIRCAGATLVSAAPFVMWFGAEWLYKSCITTVWSRIFRLLPNTAVRGKRAPLPPPSPPSLPQAPAENADERRGPSGDPEGAWDDMPPIPNLDGHSSNEAEPAGPARRPSSVSARGDEYASDEEETARFRAAHISFDVEASESTDPPAGLWSAELRPSVNADGTPIAKPQSVYLDTLLTQMPVLVAGHVFTNAVCRLVMAPWEALVLRGVARTLRERQGLPLDDLYSINLLTGLNWTWAVNFFGSQFLHLVLTGEVWAVVTSISQWYHLSEEQWKAEDSGTS